MSLPVSKRVRVKICCISSVDEAYTAIAAGADALGLVSEMPSGPGVIADEKIEEIVRVVPPPISSFLLTSKTSPDEIIAQQQRFRSNVLQLVDHVSLAGHKKLRESLPGISLVQVVHVMDEHSIQQSIAYAPYVDALLLDSGNPTLAIKEFGGTGRVHDWQLSREIVKRVTIPVFLAGGLNPQNAKAAVDEVKPFGLDLCSGVRTNRQLDPVKLSAFFEALA